MPNRTCAAPVPWRAPTILTAPTASSSSALMTRPFLNNQYTVWGKVTEGMDAIDALKRGEPVRNPDSIVSMRVEADL